MYCKPEMMGSNSVGIPGGPEGTLIALIIVVTFNADYRNRLDCFDTHRTKTV
jgi:hypothetical protein